MFKRAVDKSYRLKMKASRYLLTQVRSWAGLGSASGLALLQPCTFCLLLRISSLPFTQLFIPDSTPQVNTNFPTLPFTLRAMEDEKQARMGVVECVKVGRVNLVLVLHAAVSPQRFTHHAPTTARARALLPGSLRASW